MANSNKIVTVVGARPQFVKCAVMRRLFDSHSEFNEVLVHTGQHYDFSMSEVFFHDLDIKKPEYFLDVSGRNHGEMTGQMMEKIEAVVLKEKPQAMLVYGDTNSTLAGALVASKLHIPVFHIEAGLRSFNKAMPEEINRILTDHVSDLLFCSTQASIANLRNEGIQAGTHWVGDIMYDAVLGVTKMLDQEKIRQKFKIPSNKKSALGTLHRAENFADPKRAQSIIDFVQSYTSEYNIYLPLHPGTRQKLENMNLSFQGITILDPVSYLDMQALLNVCDLVLTDSGGVQKEAYFHGKKCITLRDETEWVETIDNGWNRLWTTPNFKPEKTIDEYGNGDAGQKILDIIIDRVA